MLYHALQKCANFTLETAHYYSQDPLKFAETKKEELGVLLSRGVEKWGKGAVIGEGAVTLTCLFIATAALLYGNSKYNYLRAQGSFLTLKGTAKLQQQFRSSYTVAIIFGALAVINVFSTYIALSNLDH